VSDKLQQFALVINDQMQLEAIEPAPAALAALRQPGKDFMRGNTAVMAHPNWQTVDEWNAGGLTPACLQISTEWKQG
jgi:hypothetical protein